MRKSVKRRDKKWLIFVLVWIFASASAPVLYAKDDMWTKFGRGGANVAFCLFEVPKQISVMAGQERWPIALFGGAGKGLYMAAQRLGVGLYEIFTFPSPGSTQYKAVLQPEFVLSKFE